MPGRPWLVHVTLFGDLELAGSAQGAFDKGRRLAQLVDAATGPDSARRDLDEAWQIAERGPMPLFPAEIHLYRARLLLRADPYPWQSPQHDLAEARRLIVKHGYLRCKEELEDAEPTLKHFASAPTP